MILNIHFNVLPFHAIMLIIIHMHVIRSFFICLYDRRSIEMNLFSILFSEQRDTNQHCLDKESIMNTTPPTSLVSWLHPLLFLRHRRGPVAASAKSADQISEFWGSGGMAPGKITFLIMQNAAI